MSGHSRWSQIKHKKALTDAQKSKHFSKLARTITMAAREKGRDPTTNSILRSAIEKAKEANMPAGNIERAIKRAGGSEEARLEEVLFEAYGPGGVAILIAGITDNKNRTNQEIKHILGEHGAKLAAPGSARFLFQKTEDGWHATSPIPVDEKIKEALMKLFEVLDEHDDVNDIYTNTNL
ncbi:YebC/PmpR family DNA-binding transcriptional regulator [Patescibacteria group bacterium]|nr:YebC/PmpR family DNA-binding transcriptional regulator [Patescibacteria group bacterium]